MRIAVVARLPLLQHPIAAASAFGGPIARERVAAAGTVKGNIDAPGLRVADIGGARIEVVAGHGLPSADTVLAHVAQGAQVPIVAGDDDGHMGAIRAAVVAESISNKPFLTAVQVAIPDTGSTGFFIDALVTDFNDPVAGGDIGESGARKKGEAEIQ